MASSAYSLDEDKELLLSRSQDLQWVDDVTEFQCVRCNKVLIRHYIANCGHKFCFNCKKLVGDGSKRWRCPIKECNRFIEDIHLQDVFFEETVFELRTHCPNHKYGCPIIGPLKDIGGHLRKCVDTRENALPVLLDQSKGLDSAFAIKQMDKLNEKMKSFGSTLNDIGKAMEEKELVQERKWAEYDRKRVNAKVMVSGVVRSFEEEKNKRAQLTSNINENSSQLTTLNERLETMGLLLNEMRKSMEETKKEKLEMGQTMSQLSAEVSALKEKLNETEEIMREKVKSIPAQEAFNNVITPEFQHLRIVSEYYKEKADFTWIASHVNSLLNESKKELVSGGFPLTGYPFGVQAKLQLISDRVRFSLCFKPLNESNAKGDIGVKLIPIICLTVKDQSKGKERKDCIRRKTFYYDDKTKFEFNSYYYIGDVAKSHVNCPLYTVDGKWMIDIHVEAPEVTQSVFSYDRTLTWAIDDFRKRKQMEVEGLILCHLSPYFYTSAKGYRMQVRAYLNGCDAYKNNGVSIFVAFLDGVNDEDHKGSFVCKATVTFFHPTQPHRNISKSKQYNFIAYGDWFHMESEAEIEGLLYNGTLYYKVTAEVIKR